MDKQEELELADKYFEEGIALHFEIKYQQATKLFEQASSVFEKWEVWEKWMKVNNHIGWTYCYWNKVDQGIAHLQQTLITGQQYLGNNHLEIASNLNNTGTCYRTKLNFALALNYHQKALAICKKEVHPETAKSLLRLGLCHRYKGDYNLAIEYYQKALASYPESKYKTQYYLALILNNIGVVYKAKGDYDLAISYHQKALSIRKKHLKKGHLNIGMSFNNLGNCYQAKGDYDIAINYHQKALAVLTINYGEEHGNVATSLNNHGLCYEGKGEYDLAIHYHQKALEIRKKILGKKHPNFTQSLNNLGCIYYEKEAYDLAIHYHQKALTIRKKIFGKNHPDLTQSLINMGICHLAKADYTVAIGYYQQALTTLTTTFKSKNIFQNPTLNNYNESYFLLKSLDEKATSFFFQYLEHSTNLKYLQVAFSTIHLATNLVTDMRQSYKTDGSKYTLAEEATRTYNQSIKIALALHELYHNEDKIEKIKVAYQEIQALNPDHTIPKPENAKKLAFTYAEQSKATLLLSSLKDSEAKDSANIPADLLEKEKQVKIELNYLDKSIATQEAKGDKKDEALLSKFQSQHFDYKQQYDELIEQFEVDYPEYYRLKYAVETASVEAVQNYLSLNNETIEPYSHKTILISYHIAEDQIYIFTITATTYKIATVAKPDDLSNTIEDLQTAINVGYPELFINASTSLFDLLLQPVWTHIQALENLVIIPHDELYYIPFDVLINQQQVGEIDNFADLPYLIRAYNISYHYSATMLLHSHERQQQTSTQADSFFGLAPIEFGSDNKKRTKQGYVVKSSNQGRKVILKSSGDKGAALQDLADTEAEVKEIYQLFEKENKEAIALFYDQANKENLQSYVSDYKYVLISTHGFLQETGKGTLQGIHLAPKNRSQDSGVRSQDGGELVDGGRLTVDGKEEERGQEVVSTDNNLTIEQFNNYILHTSETYHLKLSADLVVLSSCESGIGDLQKGEGMMALNRGFLYAGAANIIYSLFKVPQDSTSKLTQALFAHILKGDSYAEALRKAKLELIMGEFAEPRDWSGFALIGR